LVFISTQVYGSSTSAEVEAKAEVARERSACVDRPSELASAATLFN